MPVKLGVQLFFGHVDVPLHHRIGIQDNILAGPGNHMVGNHEIRPQMQDGCRGRIHRSLCRGHVSGNGHRNQGTAVGFVQQMHIRRFQHLIGSLQRGQEASGFNHAKRLHSFSSVSLICSFCSSHFPCLQKQAGSAEFVFRGRNRTKAAPFPCGKTKKPKNPHLQERFWTPMPQKHRRYTPLYISHYSMI